MPPSHSPIPSLTARLSQWICGLHGHDMHLRIGSDHLALTCRHCGLNSPGWAVGQATRQPIIDRSEPAEPAPTAAPASAPAR
jgi:hypothetical protein